MNDGPSLKSPTATDDEACERLGLPTELARQWEALPKPAQTFDPATAPPPPSVPTADTG